MHFRRIFEFLRVNPWHVKSLRAEFYEVPLLTLEPVADISGFAAVRCKFSWCRALGQNCSCQRWAGTAVGRDWGCIWDGIEACVLLTRALPVVGSGWDMAVLTG